MHYEPQVSIFLMMVLVTSNQNFIIIQICIIILFHIIYLIILCTQKKKKKKQWEICEIFDLSAFQEMKPAGSVYSWPTLSVGKEQNFYSGVPYYNSYISHHASLKMSSRLSHILNK